jgi:NAD(P)-dependent dehydrogenase (short-subunit alcohol dehydrogenase family)
VSYRLGERFDLSGRVAIITGAANILGPEFAAGLAEFGANLALVDIDGAGCREAAKRVSDEFGVSAIPIEADVSDESSVAGAVDKVLAEFGRLDILINAAATKTKNYFKPLAEYSLEEWNEVMGVNLGGMFLTAKKVIPHFIEQKSGNIINIASIYGMRGPDPRIYEGSSYLGQEINTPPIYSASKGGVISFTRYLATTLAPQGIRANSITPGGVFSGQNEAFTERYGARVPLGRMAEREELRGAALYLASDASSYVTGQNLVVDGGLTAW